jgi:hypothetical protein
VVAALTASRIVTADLDHRGRPTGGCAVKVAPVIDIGTVMLRRLQTGTGAVRGLSLPRSWRVLPRVARGDRELRGVHSCACRVVPIYCAVMAGDAQRGIALSMLVHFAAATKVVA